MEKIFCIKTKIISPSVSEVEEGKWYVGEEFMNKVYRIFGEGKSTPSELVIPEPTGFRVDGVNIYDNYIGMFKKELFITQTEFRDKQILSLFYEINKNVS
jgi:hypothetical protein